MLIPNSAPFSGRNLTAIKLLYLHLRIQMDLQAPSMFIQQQWMGICKHCCVLLKRCICHYFKCKRGQWRILSSSDDCKSNELHYLQGLLYTCCHLRIVTCFLFLLWYKFFVKENNAWAVTMISKSFQHNLLNYYFVSSWLCCGQWSLIG